MKSRIRKNISVFMLSAVLLMAGCGNPPMPPSDAEMTRHFLTHEMAFDGIREVIARCPYGMYYPPYDMQDTACLKGISMEDRHTLDSLLEAISCERVFYFGKEAKRNPDGTGMTRHTQASTYRTSHTVTRLAVQARTSCMIRG